MVFRVSRTWDYGSCYILCDVTYMWLCWTLATCPALMYNIGDMSHFNAVHYWDVPLQCTTFVTCPTPMYDICDVSHFNAVHCWDVPLQCTTFVTCPTPIYNICDMSHFNAVHFWDVPLQCTTFVTCPTSMPERTPEQLLAQTRGRWHEEEAWA